LPAFSWIGWLWSLLSGRWRKGEIMNTRLMFVALISAAAVMCFGCRGVNTSEAQRQNAAATTDLAKFIYQQGVEPNSPVAETLLMNAEANELLTGSPRVRLLIDDAEGMEKARQEAAADDAAGGFWGATADNVLGILGFGLTFRG